MKKIIVYFIFGIILLGMIPMFLPVYASDFACPQSVQGAEYRERRQTKAPGSYGDTYYCDYLLGINQYGNGDWGSFSIGIQHTGPYDLYYHGLECGAEKEEGSIYTIQSKAKAVSVTFGKQPGEQYFERARSIAYELMGGAEPLAIPCGSTNDNSKEEESETTSKESTKQEEKYGGYNSWNAYCKGEFGSDSYYDEDEHICKHETVSKQPPEKTTVSEDPLNCPVGTTYVKTEKFEVCAITDQNAYNEANKSPLPESNDFDKDGIPNEIDKCPNKKETKNLFEDRDGCPDIPPIRSHNIKSGERYINTETIKISELNWIIKKGSDTMSAIVEYYSPNDVQMKCPKGCTDAQMEALNKIATKTFGSHFEKTLGDILGSTALAPYSATKGLVTTMWEQSKFFHRDLPQHMSETEAQTWHVILTGDLVILDKKTEFLVETDQTGTRVYVLEDFVDIFYKDTNQPIRLNANEYVFASENNFEKKTFEKSDLDYWWKEYIEINNIFEKMILNHYVQNLIFLIMLEAIL
ncbi:MAG: hypothetical protein HQ505_03155 [Nitrosopumilus sp.]|nr:hypothetical protein [Nitrosopumilus sp.]